VLAPIDASSWVGEEEFEIVTSGWVDDKKSHGALPHLLVHPTRGIFFTQQCEILSLRLNVSKQEAST